MVLPLHHCTSLLLNFFLCVVAVSKEQKTEEKEERDNRTLCCKNVPYKIFSQKVMSLFKEVREVHLVKDRKTQKCTG